MPVGALSGCAVLAVFGRPDRRPSLAAIHRALLANGVEAADVTMVDRNGRRTLVTAPLVGGGQVLAKVFGGARRDVDLLCRLYRYLRFREAGDGRPFASLRRAVEHEALMSFAARDAGVSTPRMLAVTPVGLDSVLIFHSRVESVSLATLADGSADEALLRRLFGQLAAMRARRLVHRGLSASAFLGRP